MLIFSYIIAAGLELVIVYNNIKFGTWSLVWAYGFLLTFTVFSVHAEDSTSGKAARKFFKSLGIKSEGYDLISNLMKIAIYILVLTSVISYYLGAVLAYLIIFFTVISVFTKFTDAIKNKKDE